jgi:2'-5' RNA ligase
MNEHSRYAFYLIPPYPIARDIAEIHTMLEKQYGFYAAGRFQAHCTIKGFFKKNDKPVESLIRHLDDFMKGQTPFVVEFSGYRTKKTSIVLKLDTIDGMPNQELNQFREKIVEITRPYIAPDCDFVDSDLGVPFKAHFTLAFRDIPVDLFDQVIAWLEGAPVPIGKFEANTFHFLEFFSEDWKGPWWESLTWKLHKSWRTD